MASLFHPRPPLLGKQSRIIKLLGKDPRPVRDFVALGSVEAGGGQLKVHHLVLQFGADRPWDGVVGLGFLSRILAFRDGRDLASPILPESNCFTGDFRECFDLDLNLYHKPLVWFYIHRQVVDG